MLALPEGITMEFLKRKAKQGMLNHISNLERKQDYSLSQIGKQIARDFFNFEDWSVGEDPRMWSYDESFVHSLAGRTYNIDHRGWFRHRLDQFVVFKDTFQDEPFQKQGSRSDSRSPLEFILANWITKERHKWGNNLYDGYSSENDWKWSQMKQANIPFQIRPRITERRKKWDEDFNDIFLPIFHCYNACNNKDDYFTVQVRTNRKDKIGRPITATQFKIDFPSIKFKNWISKQKARLKGNFGQRTGERERQNYEESGY